MSLVSELKRRKVFRVAATYLVVGWLLTEVLTTILPTLGAPEWAARAVIRIFAFGFIPTVVLSWIYEITPNGIRRDAGVNDGHPDRSDSIRMLDYVAVVGIAFAVIFGSLISARQSGDGPTVPNTLISENSVAVLPFVNLSGDKDNDYFSDGLTETLLHMLAQIPDLKVAARTSSFAFRDKNMDIQDIADALHVGHILEGSVQQSGNRVRMTAQLIRAADGFHVWSENYDRTNDDIFAIQDEIAIKVGSALSASLINAEGGSKVSGVDTNSQDAYDLYLQALKERRTFSYGGLQAAEELLKGALTIDPDFLDAKTELAGNYLHQYETGLMDQDDAFAEALALTDQVLTSRPNDLGAGAIQLFVRAVTSAEDGNSGAMTTAARELEDLLAKSPDKYEAQILLTRLLQGSNQAEKALQLQQSALLRDPFNPRIHFEIGSLYLELNRLTEAQASLQKSLDIEALQPNAYTRLAITALQTGDGVEYLRHQIRAMVVDPKDHEIPGFIAGFLYQLGFISEGDDFRDRVVAIAPTSEIAYRIELLRAIAVGDEEASVAAARRAIADDIEDRQFSYGGAVQHLMRVAAKRNTVEIESRYLEEQAPGILDVDAVSAPVKYRLAQLAAFDAWYTSLSHDELRRRLEKLREIAMAFGRDPMDDPKIRVIVAAMTGDTELAIQTALSEVFTQPVARNLGWRDTLAQAQFTDFVEDPRIQVAMQNWEDEETKLRNSVGAYLVDVDSGGSATHSP